MALTPKQKEKRNYNYGKIVNGVIEYAPYYLVIGNRCYTNATQERYLSQGWKKIVYTELPEDEDPEAEYREVITEDDVNIYSGWVKIQ